MTKIEKTLHVLAAALEHAERPVLPISGGKDSLLLLELCRPYRAKLHVVWARTTAAFPHMIDFVHQAVAGWDFKEIITDQDAYFARYGWPSALIPVRHRPHERNGGILIQSKGYCCKALQYEPLACYLKDYAPDVMIHGQTREDIQQHKLAFPTLFRRIKPLKMLAPLREWSGEETLAYCMEHNIALPMQYANGVVDSLECWNCTVRTDLARFQWMREHTPSLAKSLGEKMECVYGAAIKDYETHIQPILEAIER